MIKIHKKAPPTILKENKEIWTKELLDAVDVYKGYDKIPSEIKDNLLIHYRHKDIQKALFESGFHKCAFCECKPAEGGNIEVEHFIPKSIHPKMTFEWDNLLPACRKCNEAKSDFDTAVKPIINPAIIDPETVFTYDFLRIIPIQSTLYEEIADTTVEICNLNSSRLYEARASLLKAMTEYRDDLEEKINLIHEADTERKRKLRITKLKNSIEKFEQTMNASSCYAGYCRWFAKNDPIYAKAKSY